MVRLAFSSTGIVLRWVARVSTVAVGYTASLRSGDPRFTGVRSGAARKQRCNAHARAGHPAFRLCSAKYLYRIPTKREKKRHAKHWQRAAVGYARRTRRRNGGRRTEERGTASGVEAGAAPAGSRESGMSAGYIPHAMWNLILCYLTSAATHSYLYSTVAGGGYRTVRLINRYGYGPRTGRYDGMSGGGDRTTAFRSESLSYPISYKTDPTAAPRDRTVRMPHARTDIRILKCMHNSEIDSEMPKNSDRRRDRDLKILK